MYADDLALFLNNLNCALDLAKLIFLFQGLKPAWINAKY